MLPSRKSLFLPALSFGLYTIINYMQGFFIQKDTILDLSLHLMSFSLIALAGNATKERIEMQIKQIEKLEEDKIKMEGYKRLYGISADLAHELRNPLTSISASVQFLKEGRNERDFIDILSSETERLSKLVNDFLMFSRPADANKEDIDIPELVNYLKEKIFSDKEIELKLFEPHVLIKANRTFIESAISNIIINAVQAAKAKVLITLKRLCDSGMQSDANDKIVIYIEDDGDGIEDAVKDKIFEPFITTKPHGTGLGLAIAERIIKSLDGDITVGKSEMGGAKFAVVLGKHKGDICMR
jgi:signal transduction histidine kinase